MNHGLDRRTFVKTAALTGAGLACGTEPLLAQPAETRKKYYTGPNIIIVRFGGGVRRRETLEESNTYCPYFLKELAKRGTLFNNMFISETFKAEDGREVPIQSSHGEGTLNILTGRYAEYVGVTKKYPEKYDFQLFDGRFEATVPTVFEYFRKAYDIPSHQTLIINNEDRTDEEFYSFSNHHLFGVNYRCHTLSLYRYKCFVLRQQIESGQFAGAELAAKQRRLNELESIDFRAADKEGQGVAIDGFWQRWREHYGDTGLINERGDRLLTELATRAMKELRPKLMMINYTDPDYVHWGNIHHYTRGISIIDQGIRRLVETVEADERYRDNTVFVIVPDCGRDNNRAMAVPCQHHFNSKAAREIFALIVGKGVRQNVVVDNRTEQVAIAPTVGQLMGFKASYVQGEVLEEAFA